MPAVVAAAAAVGALVVSVACVYQRERGERSADALIESGFRYELRIDPVSCAVADRVARLESDRKRRSLAGALRVVERIASEFERGACDPRAIIRVERLLTMPPPVATGEEQRAELGRQLRGIARLLGTGM